MSDLSYYPYFAIIGDIKRSRKIDDRKNAQDKLKRILDKINKIYKYDILSKFTITLGDEFQGLLSAGANVFNIINVIQMDMYPTEIRFGIGIGDIVTDINPELAIGADGSAFHNARSAIEYIKHNEKKNKKHVSDIFIVMDKDKYHAAEMINTILSLMSVIKKSWTVRQQEIIWDQLKYQDGQDKSAIRLGIAQSSVQRGLTKGNYYAYKEALDTVNNVLKEIKNNYV